MHHPFLPAGPRFLGRPAPLSASGISRAACNGPRFPAWLCLCTAVSPALPLRPAVGSDSSITVPSWPGRPRPLPLWFLLPPLSHRSFLFSPLPPPMESTFWGSRKVSCFCSHATQHASAPPSPHHGGSQMRHLLRHWPSPTPLFCVCTVMSWRSRETPARTLASRFKVYH